MKKLILLLTIIIFVSFTAPSFAGYTFVGQTMKYTYLANAGGRFHYDYGAHKWKMQYYMYAKTGAEKATVTLMVEGMSHSTKNKWGLWPCKAYTGWMYYNYDADYCGNTTVFYIATVVWIVPTGDVYK